MVSGGGRAGVGGRRPGVALASARGAAAAAGTAGLSEGAGQRGGRTRWAASLTPAVPGKQGEKQNMRNTGHLTHRMRENETRGGIPLTRRANAAKQATALGSGEAAVARGQGCWPQQGGRGLLGDAFAVPGRGHVSVLFGI